jgi:hypothetical protein
MAPNSRGFGGRRRDGIDPSRIPPGQYYERGFPVLSAGPMPRTPLEEWTFSTRSPSCEAAVVVLLVPVEALVQVGDRRA